MEKLKVGCNRKKNHALLTKTQKVCDNISQNFPEIIRNDLDIVVKICNNTYSMENKQYPHPQNCSLQENYENIWTAGQDTDYGPKNIPHAWPVSKAKND